jgi:small subunit ribosomal protein S14
MAKRSAIEKNEKRRRMVAKNAARRKAIKDIAKDRNLAPEERFAASLRLAKMPRNSSKVRIRNRCELTGRPRGYYRKLKVSRIGLRELASSGQVPGMVKSSW